MPDHTVVVACAVVIAITARGPEVNAPAAVSVKCRKCGSSSSGFFCSCGADLRSLYPDSVPVPKTVTVPMEKPLPTVQAFLEKVGMGEHLTAFDANGVTPAMLASVTDEDLRSLGVAMLGHRKTILDAAAALGGTKPKPAPSSSPAFVASSYGYAPVNPGAPATSVVLLALASFFIPGLGQLIQGRAGRGVAYFIGASLLWALLLLFAPTFLIAGFLTNAAATLDVVRTGQARGY